MDQKIAEDLILRAIENNQHVVNKTKTECLGDILEALRILKFAALNQKTVFVCGNGGSASQSQHFAAEWVCRYKDDRRPLKAIALTTDTSALTAIANDYSFENIFSRQLEALGSRGDVLLVLTTSGQSTNILKAISKAQELGIKIIALTGSKGSSLKNITDVAIIVPSEETARIQEVHGVIIHLLCELIEKEIIG